MRVANLLAKRRWQLSPRRPSSPRRATFDTRHRPTARGGCLPRLFHSRRRATLTAEGGRPPARPVDSPGPAELPSTTGAGCSSAANKAERPAQHSIQNRQQGSRLHHMLFHQTYLRHALCWQLSQLRSLLHTNPEHAARSPNVHPPQQHTGETGCDVRPSQLTTRLRHAPRAVKRRRRASPRARQQVKMCRPALKLVVTRGATRGRPATIGAGV